VIKIGGVWQRVGCCQTYLSSSSGGSYPLIWNIPYDKG
jgi:hypothetical protein